MSKTYSPQEALQHYFEELLDGEESLVTPTPEYAQAVHVQAAYAEPVYIEPAYVEPDAEQKRKLEKLLQSAQAQMVVTPLADLKITEVSIPLEVKKQEAVEIQEWEIESPAETAAIKPTVKTSDLLKNNYTFEGLEWGANGLPQWAQKDFDVLLFQVSGLTLAVPLISLGQIQLLTDDLTPLFGQADWFMGLLPTATGKIRTVNTAKFVMPERYDEAFLKSAKYVISINGVPWGLAVDTVNQPITLSPADVKWRSERSKRPWLAGTVKEHMCALLDVPMIGKMLMDADRNFQVSLQGLASR